MKQAYVYVLFSQPNGTLYVGVTSDLAKRVYEHKQKIVKGFTQKYGVDKLGYYEVYESMEAAITREKQLKAGSRKKKLELITQSNPQWKDLYDDLFWYVDSMDCHADKSARNDRNALDCHDLQSKLAMTIKRR